MKFWNLKFLEPSWPPQARKWTTLPLCRCYYLADPVVTVQNKTTVLHINCDMWRCGTLTCSSHTGLSVVLGLISDFQFPVWTGLRVVKFKMSHTLAHFTQLSGNLSTLFIYFDVPSFPRSHINYRLETGSIFLPAQLSLVSRLAFHQVGIWLRVVHRQLPTPTHYHHHHHHHYTGSW